jgi:hypothetical protein
MLMLGGPILILPGVGEQNLSNFAADFIVNSAGLPTEVKAWIDLNM